MLILFVNVKRNEKFAVLYCNAVCGIYASRNYNTFIQEYLSKKLVQIFKVKYF